MLTELLAALDRDGFVVVPAAFSAAEAAAIGDELSSVLAAGDGIARRSGAGTVVAARNVLEMYPRAGTVWRREPLVALLSEALGSRFGLVRVLFFDKPPDRTWCWPGTRI